METQARRVSPLLSIGVFITAVLVALPWMAQHGVAGIAAYLLAGAAGVWVAAWLATPEGLAETGRNKHLMLVLWPAFLAAAAWRGVVSVMGMQPSAPRLPTPEAPVSASPVAATSDAASSVSAASCAASTIGTAPPFVPTTRHFADARPHKPVCAAEPPPGTPAFAAAAPVTPPNPLAAGAPMPMDLPLGRLVPSGSQTGLAPVATTPAPQAQAHGKGRQAAEATKKAPAAPVPPQADAGPRPRAKDRPRKSKSRGK